jgi:hypothetical protein
VRHRGDREPSHELGPHHGRRPGQITAEVVPDQRGVGLTEGPDDARDVQGEVGRVVAAGRSVAAADAAQVHGDGTEPGVGERDQQVPPGPPELREAVQQHHQRSVADFGDVEAGAVGGHVPVDHLFRAGHVESYDRGRQAGGG